MAMSTGYATYLSDLYWLRMSYLQGHRVYVKRAWADEWSFIPYLHCLSAEETVAPSVGKASFKFHYGNIKREDTPGYAVYTPLDISGCYVALQGRWAGVPLWVGVVDYEKHTPHGTTGYLQGPQEFNAFGLEHLMDRVQVMGSYTESGYIDTPLRFNRPGRRGAGLRGNKSATVVGENGVPVFGQGATWTNLDIVQYLLQYYAPSGLSFVVNGAYAALANIVEEHELSGLSLWDALNRLIDRRRGLGFFVNAHTASGALQIEVFSQSAYPIAVGGYSLPANTNWGGSLSTLTWANIGLHLEVAYNRLATYDSIVVLGGPVYTTFTLSADGETPGLVPGWTEEQETAYLGLVGDADTNDAERKTDKYSGVYTQFTVPAAWDWKDRDGQNVVPLSKDDGTVDFGTAGNAWTPGAVFERQVNLAEDDEADEPEYRNTFVIVQDAESLAEHYVDALDAVEKTPASVSVGDKRLQINVKPQKVGHIAALNTFDPLTAGATNHTPEYDYKKYLATVCVKTDTRLAIRAWLSGVPIRETGRTKVIEYPGAEMWVILPGTVVDVLNGALLEQTELTYVRDDSETLRTVAALAAAWYLHPRTDITLRETGEHIGGCWPGSMFEDSPITSRGWDFSGAVPYSWARTGYTELDVAGMPHGPSKGRSRK